MTDRIASRQGYAMKRPTTRDAGPENWTKAQIDAAVDDAIFKLRRRSDPDVVASLQRQIREALVNNPGPAEITEVILALLSFLTGAIKIAVEEHNPRVIVALAAGKLLIEAFARTDNPTL